MTSWQPGDPVYRDERVPFACPACGTTWTVPVDHCPICPGPVTAGTDPLESGPSRPEQREGVNALAGGNGAAVSAATPAPSRCSAVTASQPSGKSDSDAKGSEAP